MAGGSLPAPQDSLQEGITVYPTLGCRSGHWLCPHHSTIPPPFTARTGLQPQHDKPPTPEMSLLKLI